MTDPRKADGQEPEPSDAERTAADGLEGDRFEIIMAEILGEESELGAKELDLLLAAGEQEGDLEDGEFSAMQDLARALEASGAIEELGKTPISTKEQAAASETWAKLAQESGSAGDVEPRGAGSSGSASADAQPAWWKRPAVMGFAAAALLLAAFLGGQRFGSPGAGSGNGAEVFPGGTLGTGSHAPTLDPTLTRGNQGAWVFALDPVPDDVRGSIHDLVIEVEVLSEDGTWRGRGVGLPVIDGKSVRWTWEGGEGARETAAERIQFKIRREVPAGRRSWKSDSFLGVDTLTPQ